MFSRSLGLVLLVCLLGAGSGYLVTAGAMPWPVPVLLVALTLLLAGVTLARRRRRTARSALLEDTEPAFVKPPAES